VKVNLVSSYPQLVLICILAAVAIYLNYGWPQNQNLVDPPMIFNKGAF